MAEQSNDAPLKVHNPFDPPKAKMNPTAVLIAALIVLGVHAVIGWYLYTMRFTIKERIFEDEKLDTQLIKPPPPPRLQPRPPIAPPPDVTPPPPLDVPPVKKEERVERPEPPVAAAPRPPEPPRPSIITYPDWSRRPNAEDLARYYPERAQRLEREGRATITCKVKANGTLEGCTLVSEDPPDMGFGDATLRASRLFKMRPQTKDGQPVDGGTVRIPLVWKLPE